MLLCKKLGERHSPAESPENNESLFQICPVGAVSGSTAIISPVQSGAGQWSRALHCIGSFTKM